MRHDIPNAHLDRHAVVSDLAGSSSVSHQHGVKINGPSIVGCTFLPGEVRGAVFVGWVTSRHGSGQRVR